MQLHIWHLQGQGFHWGRHGLGQEESGAHLPSDSLLAALMSRLVEQKGAAALDTWVEWLRQDPAPLALTSAFPRAGKLLFFPAPLRSSPAVGEARPKELKKVQFVSAGLFRRLLAGESLAALLPAAVSLNQGKVLLLAEEASLLPAEAHRTKLLWLTEKRPRVTVDRAANSSQIYFTGRTLYPPECGLWFGVRWDAPDLEREALLSDLLEDLGDAGLGGERSAGFGKVQFHQGGEVQLPDPAGGLGVTLSRWLPRADETSALQHPQAAYSLISVGGWISSPVSAAERRRQVNFLVEGSLVGPLPRSVSGQIVDVRPRSSGQAAFAHPVWRSGLGLLAGLSLSSQGSFL